MFKIKSEKGHFVVLLNGEFFCSADTYPEAEREIKDYISEGGNANERNNYDQY